MDEFPFPDRANAGNELTRDVLYRRISPPEHTRLCEDAWNIGAAAAQDLLAAYPGFSIYEMAEKEGLKIIREQTDKVSAGFRFFSEYFPKKNCIHMYLLSIALFAQKNHLTNGEAEELILAHEYFHFLEVNRIGTVSGRYTIPRFSLGPIRIGKSGIPALSEIGAHGFARTYWQTRYGLHPNIGEKPQPEQEVAPIS